MHSDLDIYVDELVRGQLARVSAVSADGRVAFLDFFAGQHGYVTQTEHSDALSEGDVVIVDVDTYQVRSAPSHLWRQGRWVGIVRDVYEEDVLVEADARLKVVPASSVDYAVNNTVEGTDSQGVLRVLSDRPIQHFGLTDSDDLSIDKFKVEANKIAETFADFGGMDRVVTRAKELIELQLERRTELRTIGARPVKGVLFTGPPGTGKTLLARIIAGASGAAFYEIGGPQIFSKWYGESENILRKVFADAAAQDRAIIFFDEIDSVAGQRDDAHEASRRVVAQLLALMDGFRKDENVVVVAATNRPDDVDVALRRPGRFDWEISFEAPSEPDRLSILRASAKGLEIAGELPYQQVAAQTAGWSSADLAAIWTEAALLAVADNRVEVLAEDFLGGFARVRDHRRTADATDSKSRKRAAQ